MPSSVCVSLFVATRSVITLFWSRFGCQQCSKCCKQWSGVRLNAEDMKNPVISQHAVTAGGVSFISFPCPLLKGGGCTVYSQRPKVCRDFPIFNQIVNGQLMFAVSTFCEQAVRTVEFMEHNFEQRSKGVIA